MAAAMGGMLSALACALLPAAVSGYSDDQIIDTLTGLLLNGLSGQGLTRTGLSNTDVSDPGPPPVGPPPAGG